MISPSTGETKNMHMNIMHKLFTEPEVKQAELLSELVSTNSLASLVKDKAKIEFDMVIEKIQSTQESEDFKAALEIEMYEEWLPVFKNFDAEVQKQIAIRKQNMAIREAKNHADTQAIAAKLMGIGDLEAEMEHLWKRKECLEMKLSNLEDGDMAIDDH
ncbi:hypothetical protein C8J56DRAFT_1065739 [Mycena floridula]|nr:hypothetical protein C8J56DRAFT_1065739 [Mycena floridula]